MTAKDRHRLRIIEYISDWDNAFPSRVGMAKICEINHETLRKHFSVEDLTEIEDAGLALRKKKSAKQRGLVYKALLKEAKRGNVAAQKEFLDRTEGKVKEKHELTGKDGDKFQVEYALDASWGELLKIVVGDNTDRLPNSQDQLPNSQGLKRLEGKI